jgi:hypothetical protein
MINPVDPFMETEPILKCIAPNQYSFVIAHPKGIISSRFVFLTSNIPNEGLKIRLFSFSFQLSAFSFEISAILPAFSEAGRAAPHGWFAGW